MDIKEQRRKRDRERYAQMPDEEKQKMLEKRREAYKQKKTNEPELMTKRCAQDRQRYANMQPEQKKARIEKVAANKILKRNTPCKESIAMVNPAYIETEQEGRTST
jgi:DNA-binding IclR family transcriptional regulator